LGSETSTGYAQAETEGMAWMSLQSIKQSLAVAKDSAAEHHAALLLQIGALVEIVTEMQAQAILDEAPASRFPIGLPQLAAIASRSQGASAEVGGEPVCKYSSSLPSSTCENDFAGSSSRTIPSLMDGPQQDQQEPDMYTPERTPSMRSLIPPCCDVVDEDPLNAPIPSKSELNHAVRTGPSEPNEPSESDCDSDSSDLQERLSKISPHPWRTNRVDDLHRLTTCELFKAHGLESQDAASAGPVDFVVRNQSGRRRRMEHVLAARRNSVTRHTPPWIPAIPHVPNHEAVADKTHGAQGKVDHTSQPAMFLANEGKRRTSTSPSPTTHADMQASNLFMRRARIDTMRSSMESAFVKSITESEESGSASVDQRVPYRIRRFGTLCRAPQILLYFFGIVQWRKGRSAVLYCKVVTVVPAFLAGLSAFSALHGGLSGIEAAFDGFHAFGCFIAMVSLQRRGTCNLIGMDRGLLDQYANMDGFFHLNGTGCLSIDSW